MLCLLGVAEHLGNRGIVTAKLRHGRLHVILHYTAAAETAGTATAATCLRSTHYSLTVTGTITLDCKLLLCGMQSRTADPELHHGENHRQATG